jgi:hypothetical protein
LRPADDAIVVDSTKRDAGAIIADVVARARSVEAS